MQAAACLRDMAGNPWIQEDLDIQEYTGSYDDPVIPYTLVLKPGLVIFSIYHGYWFWVGRRSRTCARRPLDAPPVPASRA
jgi:hypothetical protein